MFHAKKMAGSHVIVKSNNEELPDRTLRKPEDWPPITPAAGQLQGRDRLYPEKTCKKAKRRQTGICGLLHQLSLMIERIFQGLSRWNDTLHKRSCRINQNREYLYILLLSLCCFEPMVSKLCSTNSHKMYKYS